MVLKVSPVQSMEAHYRCSNILLVSKILQLYIPRDREQILMRYWLMAVLIAELPVPLAGAGIS